MSTRRVFENCILIHAQVASVDRCLSESALMHRWLNPALRCDPIGPWSTDLGAQSRFVIQVPLWEPSLLSTVVERHTGLITWAFEGFFNGRDQWRYTPCPQGTQLVNRFEFDIPNPLVRAGFNWVAAGWTQRDMKTQLQRLKHTAESLEQPAV
jgi:hypothetical protein